MDRDKFDILNMEKKNCFDFFWNEVSLKEDSYGLIRDNTSAKNKNMASIASIGFGLSAIIIGIENGFITKEQGEERVLKTLNTLYNKADHMNGFLYHFLDMNTAKRYGRCEPSIIDTALLLMGALNCAEYFGGEIEEYFEKLYKRVNWQWYRDCDKNLFYMGYHEERGGFVGAWDLYAEQFIMYALGVASPTYKVDPSMFYDFAIRRADYKQYKDIIYTHTGSLFTYQFSHAWLDFRNTIDKREINWFENSIKATLANRQYCIDNPKNLKTYNENAWGMTACLTPKGYVGNQGGLPSHNNNTNVADGTVPPCGPIGSIVFTPSESISSMNYFYDTFKDNLWGKYGFNDAYNLDIEPNWFSKDVIGIDKGISILMIENYQTELIWKLTMKNKYIKKAFELMEIKTV